MGLGCLSSLGFLHHPLLVDVQFHSWYNYLFKQSGFLVPNSTLAGGLSQDLKAESETLFPIPDACGIPRLTRLHGELIATFQYLKRNYREAGDGLLVRNSSDRTRGSGYKLKQGKFKYQEEIFYCEIRQVAQAGCGHPSPGSVQGQAGYSLDQPGLMGDVPDHGRWVGTRRSLRSLQTS